MARTVARLIIGRLLDIVGMSDTFNSIRKVDMRPFFALPILFVCLSGSAAIGADDATALLKTIQSSKTSDVERANAFEKIGDIAGVRRRAAARRFSWR